MEITYTVRVAIPVPKGPGRPNARYRTAVVEVEADAGWVGYGQASVAGFAKATEGLSAILQDGAYVAGVTPRPEAS